MAKTLKIGIVGAGFTGLAAAHRLAKHGHEVSIFETEGSPGGLAVGFKHPKWDWSLEKHYHHLFVSDYAIRKLAEEINHPIDFYRPITSTLYNGSVSQLDSVSALLKFPALPILDRLRTGFGLALMKFNPVWQPFEYLTAKTFITSTMGKKSWSVLWEPLFSGKFGSYTDKISASWFWARIFKRSSKLGYPQGGFLSLAESLAKHVPAEFHYRTSITHLESKNNQVVLTTSAGKDQLFDAVICTLPTHLLTKISGLPYPKLPGLGAVNLVLSLKQQFLSDGSYWLNINDRSMPFLAVVNHTNFIDPSHYAGQHLVYVGNYLPSDHPFFNLSAKELLQVFLPHLQKINPDFNLKWLHESWVWKAPFAQPVVTKRYSRNIPALTTTIPNLYLANIQQVYPWDRGTNYAVELGEKVAQLCETNSGKS